MQLCRKSQTRVTNFMTVLCIVLMAPTELSAAYITREQIVQALAPKISIQLPLRNPSEQHKHILDGLELDKWALEVLPEKFELREEAHKEMILNSFNYVIRFDNPQHIELGIKLALMNVGLRCYASKLSPPLTDDDKNRLQDTVKAISNAVRDSMYRHLGDLIAKNSIDQAIDARIVSHFLRKRDEPWGPTFKKPLATEELNRLIGVFEQRLALTRHRAAQRLERLKQQQGLEEERRAELMSQQTERILMEVIYPLVSAVSQATRIECEQLDSLGPQDFFPQYPQISQRFQTLDNRLAEQAQAAQAKEQEAENLTTQLAVAIADSDRIIRPQLDDTLAAKSPNPIVPNGQSIELKVPQELNNPKSADDNAQVPLVHTSDRPLGQVADPAHPGSHNRWQICGLLVASVLLAACGIWLIRAKKHATNP